MRSSAELLEGGLFLYGLGSRVWLEDQLYPSLLCFLSFPFPSHLFHLKADWTIDEIIQIMIAYVRYIRMLNIKNGYDFPISLLGASCSERFEAQKFFLAFLFEINGLVLERGAYLIVSIFSIPCPMSTFPLTWSCMRWIEHDGGWSCECSHYIVRDDFKHVDVTGLLHVLSH